MINYSKFEELLEKCKYQFIIETKDGKTCFIHLGKDIHHNGAGCLATNEKNFELEIIPFDTIDYIIVDGKKYYN